MLMAISVCVAAGVFVGFYPWPSSVDSGLFYVPSVAIGVRDPGHGRWTGRLVRFLGIRVDDNSRLAADLAISGTDTSLEDLVAFKVVLPFGLVALALISLAAGLTAPKLIMLLTAPLWWRVPDIVVSSRADRVRREIARSIPPFLQSLAVMTEAGLNLVPAIQEYAHHGQGPLVAELDRVTAEIRLGIPHAEALVRMADRCQVPDLTMAVSALVNGIERGASGVAAVIRDQAGEVWEKRRATARELAQQASVKLFIPLFLFVLPTLLLFLLGPAVYTFLTRY